MLNIGTYEGFGANSVISFKEASVVLGFDHDHVQNRIGNEWFPEQAIARRYRSRALKLSVIPVIPFIIDEGEKFTSPFRSRLVVMVHNFCAENWDKLRVDPKVAQDLVIDSGCMKIRFGNRVSDAMADLNTNILSFQRISFDTNADWQAPTLGKQKYCAFDIAKEFRDNGIEKTYARFPGLVQEDVDAAVLYVSANPKIGAASEAARASRKARITAPKSVSALQC
ncbi:hypothetical protein [Sulfitobacter sp. R18_1]|uniref:hypothetical protein n=1 Tax=Sulfitobacter sp. R18_1 TaxID=2821104 RepID=UPI001ADB49D5|nr:hypothetical protein [Sulfitobacter sp. R18_1]MBO9428772.1 hypothetical protein [Sulfitobacter sp. R18_1]